MGTRVIIAMYGELTKYAVLAAVILLVAAGCSSTRNGFGSGPRFADIQDSGPDRDIDVSNLPDAIPRNELVRIAGNITPYRVLGKTYHVNFETQGFVETGYASWYGKKFHGRKTSNGEIYDMFAMTAAHKNLPIPSYVKVTNLENSRVVVVRVNDRGPFHDGRIIDLSYAAAKKLGFHEQGTAKVRVEILEAQASPTQKTAEAGAGTTFLQAGAFRSKDGAITLQRKLAELTGYAVRIQPEPDRKLHKVLIGPVDNNSEVMKIRRIMRRAKLGDPHLVEL